MENIEYEEDLRIDADALDVEWLEQSERFAKYSRLAAQADREAKKLSERMKTIRSELILQANKEPDTTLGVGIKATDAKVEAFYRTNKDYIKAKEELHDAEYIRDIMQNAVMAFHQRKVALENLVRLQALNYFSVPSEPRNLSEEAKKRMDMARNKKEMETEDAVREKIKRKLNRT